MHRPPPTFEVSGTDIRKIRMGLGINIAQLAARAGLSDSYLRQLELGHKRNMRPPAYTALRTALGLKPDDARILAPIQGPPDRE